MVNDEIEELALNLKHDSILYALNFGVIPYIGHVVEKPTPERRKIVDKLLEVMEDIKLDIGTCEQVHGEVK